MLLWMPVEALSDGVGGTASAAANGNHHHLADHDEKGGKVRRQARRRAYKNALACVSSLLMVFLVTLIQLRNPLSNTNQRLRAQRAARERLIRSLPSDSIYRLVVPDANGHDYDLSQFVGKVTLVVNTACKCGKTSATFPQLAEIQERFGDQGFSVLAFPSNDYRQELANDGKIRDFLDKTFPDTINYPVLKMSSLNDNAVYQALERHLPNDRVRHNFYKYLVDRRGVAVKLFPKRQDPLEFADEIEALLGTPSPPDAATGPTPDEDAP